MNHIVIIGFMGSGKTRVGKKLSQDLGIPFVDVDKVVTGKMNMSMKEIFQRFGEPFYRALETVEIKDLAQDPEQKVISVGSGVPLLEQNQKYLKEMGTVVYIKGSYETLRKRLESSGNYPISDEEDQEEQEEKLRKMIRQRDQVYEKFKDVEVVTGVKSFEGLIKEIEEKLEPYLKK